MACKPLQDTYIIKCDKCEVKNQAREMWRNKGTDQILCEKHMDIFIKDIEKEEKIELSKINNPFKWLYLKLFGNKKYTDKIYGFYKGDSCIDLKII
jgi:hypothetical protein